VQPVALRYSDGDGAVSAAAEYVGDTTLPQSLWRIAAAKGLRVKVGWLLEVGGDAADRRALAALLRQRIEQGLNGARSAPPS
jgi:1-acyl-sn-glycerol-3-phosphate acyltransferase